MTKRKPTVKEILSDLDGKVSVPMGFEKIGQEAKAAGQHWIPYLVEHYPDLGDIMLRMIKSVQRTTGKSK